MNIECRGPPRHDRAEGILIGFFQSFSQLRCTKESYSQSLLAYKKEYVLCVVAYITIEAWPRVCLAAYYNQSNTQRGVSAARAQFKQERPLIFQPQRFELFVTAYSI